MLKKKGESHKEVRIQRANASKQKAAVCSHVYSP